MRDWEVLHPILDKVMDVAETDSHALGSEFTITLAEHLKSDLGVDVFDSDVLFDFLAGFTLALSTVHSVMETVLPPDCDDITAIVTDAMLSNLNPLLCLLPEEAQEL